MKHTVITSIMLLLTALLITGCSSEPIATDDPYNQADSQRSRAKQAQDELSSDTRQK